MQFRIFERENIIQGISDVSFGSMKGRKGDKRAIKFLKSLGYNTNTKSLVWAEQVFGSKVHICRKKDSGKTIKKIDGLISNVKNQILVICSADCVPVLLFDPKNEVVAALHGSRESLIKGIVKKAIRMMVLNFHSNPEEILVGLGPHIRKCHYWLKEKTHQNLRPTKFKKYFISKKEKIYFDLTKLAFDDLLKSGIKRKNIEDCKICTFCSSEKYFSHRKKEENPDFYKEKYLRFANFIGLKETKILRE